MKTSKMILSYFFLLFAFLSCQEDEPTLTALSVPADLVVNSQISTDGSGIVVFTATASNVLSYKFVFEDGTSQVSNSGTVTKRFTKTGLNTYRIVVVAYGLGGLSNSTTFDIEVESDFSDPEAIQLLTAGGSKTWYLAASEPAHLGVGPAREGIDGDWWYPKWYAAAPFEKCGSPDSDCFCDDELTFTVDGNGQLSYVQDNKGGTFFNVAHQGVVGESQAFDFCAAFDTSGSKLVSLAPAENNIPEAETRGTEMTFSDGGFMGYYVGSSTYEILSLTSTDLYVRTYDSLNADLAWYLKFSTTAPGTGGNEFQTQYNTLVWSDEFNVDGAPDPSNWGYDLGDGCPNLCGWGNGEAQVYTNDPANVVVENDLLKITAINNGGSYTSARILSKGKAEFQYGRVEIRAKLPSGGGTWPALWMLGADIDTNPWPGAGEIDIMEHVGNNQDVIQGATHDPNNFGGGARVVSTTQAGVSTDFHLYGIEWTENEIIFLLDNEVYGTVSNMASLPYNKDFFFIINIAMGGSLGGAIDPAFTQSSMEVDYIRVYQ